LPRVEWTTSRFVEYKGKKIPLGDDVPTNPIRPLGPFFHRMILIKELSDRYAEVFSSGFIMRTLAKWMRPELGRDTTLLDVGCGGLALRRVLPPGIVYNAFDVSFSDYTLDMALNTRGINVAIASVTDIPLASNQVSVVVSSEVLDDIADSDTAIAEIVRVSKRGALVCIGIPNAGCFKYHVKHERIAKDWSFTGFIRYVRPFGLELLRMKMIGWWIPAPRWLAGGFSYQLPFSSKLEYYNTNFIYAFRVSK
jgi:SAM-dependent methyltransferase